MAPQIAQYQRQMKVMKKGYIQLDFSEAPIKNRAFSEKPMGFIDAQQSPKIGRLFPENRSIAAGAEIEAC